MNQRTTYYWMPLLLAGTLLLPQIATAFDASMTLTANGTDIAGCSTTNGREDTIPILALSQSVQVPFDLSTGGATGNREHAPLQVRIAGSCDTTPLLYQALVEGAAIEATIRFYERSPSTGQTEHSFTIVLQNARLIGLTMVGVSGSESGVGDLLASFAYGRISWTYEPTGIQVEDDWKGATR